MLGIAVALLIAMTVLMWRVARNALFPPVLYNGIWAFTLLCIYLTDSEFFPVSEYACLIYLIGAAAFSIGSVIVAWAFRYPNPVISEIRRSAQSTRVALDVLLVLLIALFPYYLKVALQIAGTSNIIQALPEIRLRTVEAPNVNLFGIAGNLNILAILVAEAFVLESDGTWRRRLRSILAIVVALAYGALTGSKAGALFLFTAFFVSQVRARRIKLTSAFGVVALAVSFFVFGVVIVNLTGQNFQNSEDAAGAAGKIVVGSYLAGPPIAFSRIAEEPDALVSSTNIDRFLLEIGEKLGFAVDLPSINNATYIPISGDGESTNAYTIYFSYFKDYGWGGMILLATVAGVATILWRRAMAGDPVATLIYASMCSAILQSVDSEAFFVGLEGYFKAVAVFWLLYRLFPRFIEPLWDVGCRGLTRAYVHPS